MLRVVENFIVRLNRQRQAVKFHQRTEIHGQIFEANKLYTFKIVKLGDVRWLIYRTKRLMTLDAFANIYTDQGHAQWADKTKKAAA